MMQTIDRPTSQDSATAELPYYPESYTSVNASVLVVEDSPPQREMITKILQEIGMRVQSAADGLEALDLIAEQCPDILVLDVVMPRMNGYELCRKLKADPQTKHVLVVMCSTKGEDFDRYWGMRQGADAYIAKPFQPSELIGTIKQLLREPD
jgi:twitching motility two-component system response regulator PilH